MDQLALDFTERPPIEGEPRYDGQTYDEAIDHGCIKSSHDRIFDLMRDGMARTLAEIARAGSCSEAGAAARMRDFRKARFRAFYGVVGMESQRCDGGLWTYRLLIKGS